VSKWTFAAVLRRVTLAAKPEVMARQRTLL